MHSDYIILACLKMLSYISFSWFAFVFCASGIVKSLGDDFEEVNGQIHLLPYSTDFS